MWSDTPKGGGSTRINLFAGTNSVGRSTDSAVCLTNVTVSRKHCMIHIGTSTSGSGQRLPVSVLENERGHSPCSVSHLGSNGGTFVNMKPVTSNASVELRDRDVLSVGGSQLVVQFWPLVIHCRRECSDSETVQVSAKSLKAKIMKQFYLSDNLTHIVSSAPPLFTYRNIAAACRGTLFVTPKYLEACANAQEMLPLWPLLSGDKLRDEFFSTRDFSGRFSLFDDLTFLSTENGQLDAEVLGELGGAAVIYLSSMRADAFTAMLTSEPSSPSTVYILQSTNPDDHEARARVEAILQRFPLCRFILRKRCVDAIASALVHNRRPDLDELCDVSDAASRTPLRASADAIELGTQNPTPASVLDLDRAHRSPLRIPQLLSSSPERTTGDTAPAVDSDYEVLFTKIPQAPVVMIQGGTSEGKTSFAKYLLATGRVSLVVDCCGPSEEEFPRDQSIISVLAQKISVQAGVGEDEAADRAISLLSSVGMNSVPEWQRPLAVLSDGQRARFMIAVTFTRGAQRIVFDNFASNVDIETAISATIGTIKLARKNGVSIIILSTKADVLTAHSGAEVYVELRSRDVLINPRPGFMAPAVARFDDSTTDKLFFERRARGEVASKAAGFFKSKSQYGDFPLKRSSLALSTKVKSDFATTYAAEAFDVKPTEDQEGNTLSHYSPWQVPSSLKTRGTSGGSLNWNLGVVFGSSGTGKSTILSCLGSKVREWSSSGTVLVSLHTVASHCKIAPNPKEMILAVGGESLLFAASTRPYRCFSSGEQFKFDVLKICLELHNKDEILTMDELGSTVSYRDASFLIANLPMFLNGAPGALVLATSQRHLLELLKAVGHWVIDTDEGVLTRFDRTGGSAPVLHSYCRLEPALVREEIFFQTATEIIIRKSHSSLNGDTTTYVQAMWGDVFKPHHYMSESLQINATCYVARRKSDGALVAFLAVLPQPGNKERGITHAESRTAWREHRLVVPPRFQGQGIGPEVSRAIGAHTLQAGCRYLSVTANKGLGKFRDRSLMWEGSSANHTMRAVDSAVYKKQAHAAASSSSSSSASSSAGGANEAPRQRFMYSHYFIGKVDDESDGQRTKKLKRVEANVASLALKEEAAE